MLDQFLTSVLQLVIVVDIIGVVAYFVLGGLKRRSAPPLPSRTSLLDRLPWRRPHAVAPATDTDFSQLQRVLFSYREGLT